jgi:hypothetical protein
MMAQIRRAVGCVSDAAQSLFSRPRARLRDREGASEQPPAIRRPSDTSSEMPADRVVALATRVLQAFEIKNLDVTAPVLNET